MIIIFLNYGFVIIDEGHNLPDAWIKFIVKSEYLLMSCCWFRLWKMNIAGKRLIS